ncbi:MAG: methionine--tRNA ligase [Clostridia bacterium]
MKHNVIIGGAWPYANSSLHLGHLVALLPGDFLARYHRKLGDNVIYVSGSDCHGTPITLRAKKENKQPKDISDYYNEEFNRTFNKMNFSYDLYTQTEDDYHKQKVMEIFRKIYDNGYIIEKEEPQTYCPNCKKFLADRELILICPNCGKETKGEECDCGYNPTAEDLKNANCQACGHKVIEKMDKNLYIALPKLQSKIEKYYEENKDNWRKNSQNETLKYLKQGLVDRAVTRDLTWGVDIPVEGYENKKMYVWIDAVLGYLTATMKYCEENNLNWKEYWQNQDTIMYMVHGKDNIIFHSIILPALLLAMDPNMKLPDKIVSCEYLNINDEKISKSKGNGITILDLTEEYNIDSIRYYFINNGPEKKDSNFSLEDFKNVHNSDIVNKFGNFINRTLKFKGLEKIVVANKDKEVEDKISATYENVSKNINELEFKKAIEEIMSLVEFGNKYYDENKPWVLYKEDTNKFNDVIYNCANIIANLANLFEPVMPTACNKLKEYLNIDISKWEKITLDQEIKLENIEPLFEKIK